MHCIRAQECSFAAQVKGGSRLFRVLGHLYCDFDSARCARMKIGRSERDVPPDMMPNGYSTSELVEEGI
jgi:hypothetical protein